MNISVHIALVLHHFLCSWCQYCICFLLFFFSLPRPEKFPTARCKRPHRKEGWSPQTCVGGLLKCGCVKAPMTHSFFTLRPFLSEYVLSHVITMLFKTWSRSGKVHCPHMTRHCFEEGAPGARSKYFTLESLEMSQVYCLPVAMDPLDMIWRPFSPWTSTCRWEACQNKRQRDAGMCF